MKVDMTTEFLGKKMASPVMNASGTFGPGSEDIEGMDYSGFGAVVTKTVTWDPRVGNEGCRLQEAEASGLINRIGLENSGREVFREKELPWWQECGPLVILNLSAFSDDEFVRIFRYFNGSGILAKEANLSCPNVDDGLAFSIDPDRTGKLVRHLAAVTDEPFGVKLTPNVTSIAPIAQAAEDAGARFISLCNTFKAMVIDPRTGKIVIRGGLSGPATMNQALDKVYEVCEAVTIPVIGMGGIRSPENAFSFLHAGATAVAIGTASLTETPLVIPEIIKGMEGFLQEIGYSSFHEWREKFPAGKKQ